MAVQELGAVDLATVRRAVGERSFARGSAYARRGRVLQARWEPSGTMLTGTVAGGDVYTTAAYFEQERGGLLRFEHGECSCPVAEDCKHSAALVIAAAGAARRSAASAPARSATPADRAAGRTLRNRFGGVVRALRPAPPPSWEEPLLALLGELPREAEGTALAVELALAPSGLPGQPLRLLARPMRAGARGGWVNGQLQWGGLDHYGVTSAGYRADQLRLLGDIARAHRSRERPGYHYYGGYGNERTVDLAELEMAVLWPLLERGRRCGLALIHARPGLGAVRLREGELALDVVAAGEGAALRALLRIDGEPAAAPAPAGSDQPPPAALEPVLFVGRDGAGLVCIERADESVALDQAPIVIVRLQRPAAPGLQRMLLEGQSVAIPPAELERFAYEHCPALARLAPLGSSDSSFQVPEISPPRLGLRARHGPGHELELGWEWLYRLGERELSVPLEDDAGAPGTPFRDRLAERELLSRWSSPDGHRDGGDAQRALGELGLLDALGQPAPGPPVCLRGLASMRASTELLPALAHEPSLTLSVEGEPPAYRDVGELIEIEVGTGAIDGDNDWFDLRVSITLEGRQLPFAEVFAALARGETQLLLSDGAHFSLQTPRLTALRALIEEARDLSDKPAGTPRISRYQAGLWSELAALGVVGEQAAAWREQVDGLLALQRLPEHDPPGALRASLRPYQLEGFRWLAAIWGLSLGGILADEMGLGKTLQALALICHARERVLAAGGRPGPFLIVAPTSVVPGWVSEAQRFAPQLRVAALSDTLARAGHTLDELLEGAEVLVTTYTLLRLDAEQHRAVRWAGVILDEAQYVKNHQAKTYRCARELRAPFKLALTGTPLENNLMELWALLSITAPGLFPDPARFAAAYARPIERHGDRERLERLRRRIRPLIKRRTKEVVASDLPPKQEQALAVELHPRHRRLYETRLARERQKVLRLIDDFDQHRFTILRSITILRQLALHPGLVDARHEAIPCAKLAALGEQLQDVLAGGHRALVFSQFTSFLARVRAVLEREGIAYAYLDGSTRRRAEVLERFRSGDAPVFLISLKAGGFGLNLTEADYCFLLDPWWNPATEAQAIDRAHRIGQSRPVNVYRLISRGTIEEKVVALAARKAQLFDGVIDEGDLFAGSVTAEDIRGLLS